MTEERLSGWANLHRNLAAAAAVEAAERYAHGERQITVVTGDQESAADAERLHELHGEIEAAVVETGYDGHEADHRPQRSDDLVLALDADAGPGRRAGVRCPSRG